VRSKTTTQAKARAHARKAKAPIAIRPSVRERLIARLEGVDLRPRALLARIPFVMLVIGALALGLGITLWLSTASAQRSYQLGSARTVNDALSQQKEALERDVLEAQSAPALADAARNLGMIPSRDTAHLVQDPAGNWVVVGMPKPAQGAPPPPLNTKLPDLAPPAKPAPPAPPKPKPGAATEVPTRVTGSLPGAVAARPEVPVLLPSAAVPVSAVPGGAVPGSAHAPVGAALPGPGPLPGLVLVPVTGDTLAAAPAAPVAPIVPTVAAVPAVPAVTDGVVPVGPAQ
jgi:type II secretory pathway pseudopilin PulG